MYCKCNKTASSDFLNMSKRLSKWQHNDLQPKLSAMADNLWLWFLFHNSHFLPLILYYKSQKYNWTQCAIIETKLSLLNFEILAIGCGNSNIMICQPKVVVHSHKPQSEPISSPFAAFLFIPSVMLGSRTNQPMGLCYWGPLHMPKLGRNSIMAMPLKKLHQTKWTLHLRVVIFLQPPHPIARISHWYCSLYTTIKRSHWYRSCTAHPSFNLNWTGNILGCHISTNACRKIPNCLTRS